MVILFYENLVIDETSHSDYTCFGFPVYIGHSIQTLIKSRSSSSRPFITMVMYETGADLYDETLVMYDQDLRTL
jgi:hypothetical protein